MQKRGGYGAQETVWLVAEGIATWWGVNGLWRGAWPILSTYESIGSPEGCACRSAARAAPRVVPTFPLPASGAATLSPQSKDIILVEYGAVGVWPSVRAKGSVRADNRSLNGS